MTPRTAYFQEYYRNHREETLTAKAEKYKIRKYQTRNYGTEFIAPGLFRLWVRDGDTIRDAGEITWEGDKYSCECGRYKTKAQAVAAMVKAVTG